MSTNPAFCSTWRCPNCGAPLQKVANTWQCENKHSFDCAKQGYVNLLLSNQKNSKAPGDNYDMVMARRSFLNQGFYSPLSEHLASRCLKKYAESSPISDFSLFDAGCGEGYYLQTVYSLLKNERQTREASISKNLLAYGIDISKPAIQAAARTYKDIECAVASTFNLPVLDESQDCLLQVFAPSSKEEVYRVLKSDGLWIAVNPAEQHLHQLKQLVYDKPNDHKVSTAIPPGFTRLEQTNLSFDLSLATPEQRAHLLMMTPFYWTVSEQKKQTLLKVLSTVTASFDIQVLQKCLA
ncbi:putative RNA methyltransferase [Agaribacter flavus]|uniref:RNA methyltransferase n=1 Tax=Agaribacter flavus TaxID=1902781 RepID=A0ABV7FRA4_9ALTE